MSKKLRALLVKENELPVEIEIPNNLTSLQKQVPPRLKVLPTSQNENS